MIITVFGATGQVGKRVVAQALAAGHVVRAFGRNVDSLIDADLSNTKLVAIKGYVFDEADVKAAITGCDAIISCLGGAFDGTDKTRSLGLKNIVTQMQQCGVKRIAAVGGMGILNASADTKIIDVPMYPEQYRPVGLEHLAAYNVLISSGKDWTFVCPPNIVDEDASGNYRTNINYPPQPDTGKIAAGDIADCLLQAVTTNQYLHKRVGLCSV
jgi:putative NADH-flavin reductase